MFPLLSSFSGRSRGIVRCALVAAALLIGALLTAAPAEESRPLRGVLLESLSRDLTAHFNVEGELVLEPVRPWQPGGDSTAMGAPEGWSIRVVEFPTALSSAILVRVRVSGPSGSADEQTLAFRAQLWRDAWSARTPMERGASLDPASCDVRRIDALRDREALSTAILQPGEWMFQRSVPAGRLLSWRDVARRALVRKGDVIEVAAVDGSLQVTLKAQALQDGGRGETVRVRNLDSKREFAALVVAPNRAEVRF
jgi:flagella basal body P-ring formation protein FlgA